jgi:lipopolysaccharide export system protein LptA
MKQRINLLLIIILRGLALTLFFLVLAAVIYYLWFAGGRKTLSKPPEASSPSLKPDSAKIEEQIGVRFIEFRGNIGRIEVRADRHTTLNEGQSRLEGKVEIHDFGRRPGLEAWISCENADYDSEWNKVVLSGEVKLKRQGMELSAAKATYLRSEDSFEAEGGVKIRFKRLSSVAEKARYSLKDEIIFLDQQVEIKIASDKAGGPAYELQSDSLVYNRGRHKGRVEGQVRLAQGRNAGSAAWAEFLISEDEQYLRQVELGGGVRGEGKGDNWNSSLTAFSLKIRPFLDSFQVHAIEAAGACELRLIQQKEETTVAGEKLAIVFDRRGKLREVRAEEKVAWKRKNQETAEEQEIRAEKLDFFAARNHLHVSSPPGKRAILVTGRASVMAEEMTLNVASQGLEALREVMATINPEKKSLGERIGVFSSDQPFFSRSQALLYDLKQGWLTWEGEARLWQEDVSLQAAKIVLHQESRELEASNQVKMAIVRKIKEGTPGLKAAQVRAAQLKYFPAELKLDFTGGCEVQSADLQVWSQRVLVFLKKETAEVDHLQAQGEVKLKKGQTQAAAERGVYDWAKEIFILEGKPILEDPLEGKVSGDKLTFNLADGRIVVENQGRERSLSVIKKEE